MTRLAAILCLLLLASRSDADGPAKPKPKPKRPNVVLIMTDDMGYADLGCYGCKDIRTPHIDSLAKAGVRFTDFYSNGPVCTPTRAGLLTGRWQQRVGLEWAIFAGQKDPGLPTTEVTLARLLRDAGYRTGMFGKWHLGYRREYGPNAHGFEVFQGLLSGNIDFYTKKERTGDLDWYENTESRFVKGYATDVISDAAVDFIDKHAGKEDPFFVYVPYNGVHWPFQPPGQPKDERTAKTWVDGDRKGYAAMLECIDQGVGRILAALVRHKIAEDTLVIFTNDNGGERLSDNSPLFHRKATLWEGGIRVPCLIRWTGQVPAGLVSRQPGISMDLAATIIAASGATLPRGRALDGVDLLPLLRQERVTERTFFWRIDRADRKQKAVRHGDWKFLRDGVIELLYNLANDVGERKDVAHLHPERVRDLRQRLEAWEKEMAREKPAHVVK